MQCHSSTILYKLPKSHWKFPHIKKKEEVWFESKSWHNLCIWSVLVIHSVLFTIMYFMTQNQGSQYLTNTSSYVPYRYVYRYWNINVSYQFNYRPYRPYRPILDNTGRYRKFFLFYLSFVIFEFLLRQTGNLFKLTY